MEVILLERINRLGNIGEIVKVKNGFGRNFLIPMKKALRANDANKKVFEARRAEIEANNAKIKAGAEAQLTKMAGVTVNLVRQASEEGKLYGSVTVRDIGEQLKAQGHDVERSGIQLGAGIKTIGSFPIKVMLHADVIAEITVNVTRSEQDAA